MQMNFQKFLSLRWALPVAVASVMVLTTGCGNTASEEPAAQETTETAPAPEATTDTTNAGGDTNALPPIDTNAASKPVGDKQPPKAN